MGHLHFDGTLDIPYPRPIRDALLEEGLAEQHPWIPNSGWTAFRIRKEADLAHALWLMRLSYIRYAFKTAAHPTKLLEEESASLRLTPRFKSLLEKFVPTAATDAVQVSNI